MSKKKTPNSIAIEISPAQAKGMIAALQDLSLRAVARLSDPGVRARVGISDDEFESLVEETEFRTGRKVERK